MVSAELAFHFIDRAPNKNTSLTSLFGAPVIFIHSFDSSCSSDYNPDVSSWVIRELHLLKVWFKWPNTTHDHQSREIESISLQISSFLQFPRLLAASCNLQLKAGVLATTIPYAMVFIPWTPSIANNKMKLWPCRGGSLSMDIKGFKYIKYIEGKNPTDQRCQS